MCQHEFISFAASLMTLIQELAVEMNEQGSRFGLILSVLFLYKGERAGLVGQGAERVARHL